MGMRRARRRWDTPAANKIAMARTMIEEADRRWHGMDRNDELVGRRGGNDGRGISPRREPGSDRWSHGGGGGRVSGWRAPGLRLLLADPEILREKPPCVMTATRPPSASSCSTRS
jgi:hypothetical protein